MMAVEKRDTNKILTHFGSTVWSLMAERGITKQTELMRLLETQGLKVSHGALSKWLYGEAQVNRAFPEAFAKALHLGEDEMVRLSYAFAYGQKKTMHAMKQTQAAALLG